MKKSLTHVLVAACLTSLLVLVPVTGAQQDVNCETDAYAAFLDRQYDLRFTETVDQAAFTSALVTISGETETPAAIDLPDFSGTEAVLAALYYANFDELALTFSPDKVDEALNTLESAPAALDETRAQELAAALDSGLFDPACAPEADLAAPVSPELATYLLGQVLRLEGAYKNFVGYVSDPDIYSRLAFTWNSFDQVLLPELQTPANALIRQGVITGYNLKRTALNADFDPELALVYGHANPDHARQLIALLRSEGLDARVLLEPKTSAFLYLAEWGTPTSSPEFQVEPLDDGNYIAYAKEFDLAFEFADQESRDAFDALIKAHAKKDADDEPGLILGSWWQPLYSARVAVPDYVAVRNNVVYLDQYYLQSFSLVENSEAIAAGFREAFPEARVEVWDLWVNDAFHRYLLGEPA